MFESRNKRTEIADLGEFGLIKRLTKNIKPAHQSTLKGIGDDAAVLNFGGQTILFSQDMFVEGIDFDLTYFPLKHLGYKMAIANFSDVYAMNGKPTHLNVGLAVSNRFSVEALETIISGIKMACKQYSVDYVGGDIASSPKGLTISMSILGTAEKDKTVYRSGAQENDLLCVSGDLGAAFMGLLILDREKQVYKTNPDMQPQLEGNDYLLERQLKPEARKDIIEQFEKLQITPTAMIDISDGLASEILHLCTASKVGCYLYEEKIPIDYQTEEAAKQFNIAPTVAALSGGEDFELLFTLPQDQYEKIKVIKDIAVIGHIVDISHSAQLITKDNKQTPITAQGWDALLKVKEPKKREE